MLITSAVKQLDSVLFAQCLNFSGDEGITLSDSLSSWKFKFWNAALFAN